MNASGSMLTIRNEPRETSAALRGEVAITRAASFQRLSADFVATAGEIGQSFDQAKLERLRRLRIEIVEALLAIRQVGSDAAPSLNAIASACKASFLRSNPRTPDEEQLFRLCLAQTSSAAASEISAVWFAAMLMAWHAFDLPDLPALSDMPQDLWASWLTFLLEAPPAFAHIGDGERFARYLQRVCDQLLQQLRSTVGPAGDVGNAFLASQAFVQSYFNELNLRGLMTTRAAIIEDILTRRGATLDQLRVMRPCKDRPRIGFIVLSAGDGAETTGVASHLERLDRRRFETRLYSIYEPAGTMGALCRASAETFVKLPEDVGAAVARLRADDLDIAFFLTNLTAVVHLLTQIAAHRIASTQGTTLASVATTGLRNMDVMFSSAPNETENSPAHYTERLVLTDGVIGCAPYQYMRDELSRPAPVSRSEHGIPDDAVLFFSGANFYKIVPELSRLWLHILSQVPNSHLLLMPFNPNWSSSYPLISFNSRLQAQASAAGVTLDRVHIHRAVPTIAHLYRIMEMADIYLDGFPFAGALSLSDALAVGLPIVARAGTVFRSRMSKAILEEAGLGDWVFSDDASYAQHAIDLARNPDLRRRERERLNGLNRTGLRFTDTAPFAAMMMRTYDRAVTDWNAHAEALHAIEPDALAQKISALASDTASKNGLFTDRDLVLQVVLPYLRNGGTRRLIEVGAFVGGMTKPFLQEGWQAVAFEPDQRCQQHLADLVKAHPGQVRVEKAAVTADRDGGAQFHHAEVPGLSSLSPSPFVGCVQTSDVPAVALARYIAAKGLFDVDFINIDAEGHDFAILNSIDFNTVTPRMILVGFDQEYAGQDRVSVDHALRAMRDKRYRACVICLRTFGEFKRYEWPKSLLAIGIDTVPSLPTGSPLFGNILFFRADDHIFLPSLCDWLEQPFDRERRGLMSS
jgi:FkbM family methyltransferase